jgi:hypothetical protein
MNVPIFRNILSIFLLSLSYGCANLNYQAQYPKTNTPDTSKGYFYGRFFLDKDSMNLRRFGLQIQNTSNKTTYSFKFSDVNPVYAVVVEPGTYKIEKFVFAPWGAILQNEIKTIPLPDGMSYLKKPFIVEAGKCYYLGDFFGISRRESFVTVLSVVAGFAITYELANSYAETVYPKRNGDVYKYERDQLIKEQLKAFEGIHMNYGYGSLGGIKQNFEATTNEFKSAYPHFSLLEIVKTFNDNE